MKKIYSVICTLLIALLVSCGNDETTIVLDPGPTSLTISLNENRFVGFAGTNNGYIKYDVKNSGEQNDNVITKLFIDDNEIITLKDSELPKTGEVYVGKGTHTAVAKIGSINVDNIFTVSVEQSCTIIVFE